MSIKNFVILIYCLTYSLNSFSEDSLCDILKLPNCESVSKLARRSSGKSLPSTVTASQFNPANVSHDRGFGIEAIYQSRNSLNLGLVTGTGRTGAALLSANMENSFFGNRIIELDEDQLNRRLDKQQYESQKYSLAFGAGLIKNKKVGFDIGILTKYNTNIKNLNLGGGTSIRLGPLSFGASLYKDDVFLSFDQKINYRSLSTYASSFGTESYQEKFYVQTTSVGLKLGNLFLDWGQIKTHYKFYDDDVKIDIFSSSYIWKKFLLNFAYRSEESPQLKFENGKLKDKRIQNTIYSGIQFSLNKYSILGVHYNYYLLGEVAGSLTLFF